MTITENPASCPDSPPEERCAYYRAHYSLAATVDAHTGNIVLPIGGLVGAVVMPSELGRRVQQGLSIRMFFPPIVVLPQSRVWTFITGPGVHPRDWVINELAGLGVLIVADGDHVVLPSPESEKDGLWRWQADLKKLQDLPPQTPVLSTTRALTASDRSGVKAP